MILQGQNIILLAGGKAIAAAKSCELEISANAIPVASPSDGVWEDAIPGRKSWKTSCSHLLTGIVDSAAMIGTVVTLRLQLQGEIGLPFNGVVENPEVDEETTADMYNWITWDSTNKRFLAVFRTTRPVAVYYYASWTGDSVYKNNTTDKYFYNIYNGINTVYKKTATDLIPEALQGSAIVRDWKVVGTLGNLAQGSFRFHGKGALTNPTT